MDFSVHKQNVSHFRNLLTGMKINLEVSRRENSELADLESKHQLAYEAKTRTINYVEFLKRIHKMLIIEDNDFKERRIEELNVEISNALAILFPAEGFTAKIDVDLKHQNQRADLTLIHRNGTERIPDVSEGKMLQQLVGFSSGYGFTIKNGKYIMLMDEAFSAAHPDSLSKLSDLIRYCIEADMQIIMIEQSHEGYRDLPRREFHIHKDEISGAVVLNNVLDF